MTTKTEIKERPLIFSSNMVRAILAGRKSQTRRIVKPSNSTIDGSCFRSTSWAWRKIDLDASTIRHQSSLMLAIVGKEAPQDLHLRAPCHEEETFHRVRASYEVGDRLWVKEAWGISGTGHGGTLSDYRYHVDITYRTDNEELSCEVSRETHREYDRRFWADDGDQVKWRSPIHMPRWASRTTLEITEVRVQRLNEISEADAIAEGAQCPGVPASLTNVGAYAKLWESLHGEGSWKANPWVWAISFKRIEPADDQ